MSAEDRAWVSSHTADLFGGRVVISRGVAHRPEELPGFVACKGSERVGLAIYRFVGDACELVTLDALVQWAGIGTALLEAVERSALQAGCGRVWLITTNDNVDALRFYQRRGYVLSAVYPNAIETSRALKPSIPRIGQFGIPIRDELQLAKPLQDG